MSEQMSFKDSLKVLGLLDYGQQIWSAHPTGELYHIKDYIDVAEFVQAHKEGQEEFKEWLQKCIASAKDHNCLNYFFTHLYNTILEAMNRTEREE